MRRERFWKKACAILVCCLVSAACFRAPREREILVSTAISLKDAFEELGELYERQSGVAVRLNLGSSGVLQKQIEGGAPADVFASAGMRQMDVLESAGLIAPGTRRTFARNRLVVVLPSGSPLELESFEGLAGPEWARLAIGNPQTVPAGQYAAEALEHLRIWDRLQARLVPAGNVRQVLDYVVRGEVDAGFVYASDVPSSRGKAVIAAAAPEGSHAPILYPIAQVRDAASPGEARAFIDLVAGGSGQAILERHGFLPYR